MTSTRAKAPHNIKRSGPFLRRDLVPFYSAIDIGFLLVSMKVKKRIERGYGAGRKSEAPPETVFLLAVACPRVRQTRDASPPSFQKQGEPNPKALTRQSLPKIDIGMNRQR